MSIAVLLSTSALIAIATPFNETSSSCASVYLYPTQPAISESWNLSSQEDTQDSAYRGSGRRDASECT
ncbi:MAG: hypothetical protein IGR80_16215 [Synechococcales cyanobacterium K44_A2020_017]|jgi:hypothetical protein|uniref:hypothetical protein n=1 Tax=Leptolyngbya sp. CCY15150 TaxID=2767772 RepID=UPI00195020B0|nr:hypothetical protein [Leptolyngbya sp. CCY15150]MBF2087662.1 hypothetical protein [Synechococcales cyanobacterium K32_A2020_035]MBF2096283.1 hypothetical protein [Synechococcales cyanobacterium K44_A2020_017]